MPQKSIGELFDFTGKTVIVTGGAMGIGFGIVSRFAEAGANVVIADVADQAGHDKAWKIGNKALFVHTDVSSEEDVKNCVAQAVERFGRLDVLVNNAGIFPNVPAMDLDVALWDKIQAINLKGSFMMSREGVRAMKGGGVIVNVASIDALHPSMVGLAAYDASKHGMWGFTKNFALEVASMNVRVNAIAPGGIATEGTGLAGDGPKDPKMAAVIEQFSASIPMKRMGVPDDIATVALFLASDASRYMTGSIVVVDGGVLLS